MNNIFRDRSNNYSSFKQVTLDLIETAIKENNLQSLSECLESLGNFKNRNDELKRPDLSLFDIKLSIFRDQSYLCAIKTLRDSYKLNLSDEYASRFDEIIIEEEAFSIKLTQLESEKSKELEFRIDPKLERYIDSGNSLLHSISVRIARLILLIFKFERIDNEKIQKKIENELQRVMRSLEAMDRYLNFVIDADLIDEQKAGYLKESRELIEKSLIEGDDHFIKKIPFKGKSLDYSIQQLNEKINTLSTILKDKTDVFSSENIEFIDRVKQELNTILEKGENLISCSLEEINGYLTNIHDLQNSPLFSCFSQLRIGSLNSRITQLESCLSVAKECDEIFSATMKKETANEVKVGSLAIENCIADLRAENSLNKELLPYVIQRLQALVENLNHKFTLMHHLEEDLETWNQSKNDSICRTINDQAQFLLGRLHCDGEKEIIEKQLLPIISLMEDVNNQECKEMNDQSVRKKLLSLFELKNNIKSNDLSEFIELVRFSLSRWWTQYKKMHPDIQSLKDPVNIDESIQNLIIHADTLSNKKPEECEKENVHPFQEEIDLGMVVQLQRSEVDEEGKVGAEILAAEPIIQSITIDERFSSTSSSSSFSKPNPNSTADSILKEDQPLPRKEQENTFVETLLAPLTGWFKSWWSSSSEPIVSYSISDSTKQEFVNFINETCRKIILNHYYAEEAIGDLEKLSCDLRELFSIPYNHFKFIKCSKFSFNLGNVNVIKNLVYKTIDQEIKLIKYSYPSDEKLPESSEYSFEKEPKCLMLKDSEKEAYQNLISGIEDLKKMVWKKPSDQIVDLAEEELSIFHDEAFIRVDVVLLKINELTEGFSQIQNLGAKRALTVSLYEIVRELIYTIPSHPAHIEKLQILMREKFAPVIGDYSGIYDKIEVKQNLMAVLEISVKTSAN